MVARQREEVVEARAEAEGGGEGVDTAAMRGGSGEAAVAGSGGAGGAWRRGRRRVWWRWRGFTTKGCHGEAVAAVAAPMAEAARARMRSAAASHDGLR